MPLYEYECKQCRQRLEKIQSFSASPEKICPKCGGELERVISAPAIQFKGAGWYVNDYAKSGGKGAPSTDSASKSEDKSDKSAAASDNKADSGSKTTSSDTKSSSATTGAATGGGASQSSSSGSSSSGSSSGKND